MARKENRIPTKYLKIATTPQVVEALGKIVQLGLFGKTPTEVAEGLICDQLRAMGLAREGLSRLRKPPRKMPGSHKAEKRRA